MSFLWKTKIKKIKYSFTFLHSQSQCFFQLQMSANSESCYGIQNNLVLLYFLKGVYRQFLKIDFPVDLEFPKGVGPKEPKEKAFISLYLSIYRWQFRRASGLFQTKSLHGNTIDKCLSFHFSRESCLKIKRLYIEILNGILCFFSMPLGEVSSEAILFHTGSWGILSACDFCLDLLSHHFKVRDFLLY